MTVTTNPLADGKTAEEQPDNALLIHLVLPQPAELEKVLGHLSASLPAENLLISTPEPISTESYPGFRFVEAPATKPSWTLTAGDFVNAHQLAQKNNARAILILGPECGSLGSSGLRDLANAVNTSSTDLAVPSYDLPSRSGLLNSSMLYPLNRALFATRIRFPLAIDLGLSMRMAERLAAAAQRFMALNQSDAPLWAVNEATIAGMNVEEFDVGPRDFPQPVEPDLNSILPFVAASLFSDIDAKAAFWQRPRVTPPARSRIPMVQPPATDATAEVASLLQRFRLAYTNLQEIWGLVLPPNSLLGIKRLSQTDDAAFRMPENLWVRIVFDFLVAYRLRTINRGHLLGALIPLYLAWVASHINIINASANPERHIEALAVAFEVDKAYLVARWRWPDRFNP
jgi:hypothetical protein